MEYNLFISHASEDKETFVRPLVDALEAKGISVWYDEFSLNIGDKLFESINHGLSNSRFGVVVLSPAFLLKEWTRWELSGLVGRQMMGGKVLLPIWHEVSRQDVFDFSPPLAGIVAVSSDKGIRHIVRMIINALEMNSPGSWISNSNVAGNLSKDFGKDPAKYCATTGDKHTIWSYTSNNGKKERFDLSNKYEGKSFLEKSLAFEINASKNKKISILMSDIDDLSKINKVHGVHTGDAVLLQTLKFLEEQCGSITSHYGRCGDDTFFAVLYGVGIGKCRKIATNIKKAIECFSWECITKDLTVTCSFGIARLGAYEGPKESVIRAAMGMLIAKKEGRNIVSGGPKFIGESASRNYHDYWS